MRRKLDSAFETLQVEAVHATSKLVAQDVFHRVVNIAHYQRSSSGKITNFFSEDTNGRVCVCRLTDLDDINQVQAIARKRGSVALFVLQTHCSI
jgi:Iap family predicted aminopeptidase